MFRCNRRKDLKITVHRKFNNIGTIEDLIAKRRLTFIGIVVRTSEKKIPARILLVWCNLKRPVFYS